MPSWKKVITSGSNAALSSIYANNITASVVSASQFTGSLFGTASWATNALTASSADAFLIRSGLTLTGSLNASGSTHTITGSLRVTSITSSLQGTASWATNAVTAITSSYPIAVTGSTLYSTSPLSTNSPPTTGSIFLGTNAGKNATNAIRSNFFGNGAGNGATNAQNSNFFGSNTGEGATGAQNSNFFGTYAGAGATSAGSSNFFGTYAGFSASVAQDSNFFGNGAGNGATNANFSNFFGQGAGNIAINANASNFFGYQAGFSASNANASNFFGTAAGYEAANANASNFFGINAGYGATNANYSNFLGYEAGIGATNANYSNFFGQNAGLYATNANRSNFIGELAGNRASTGSYSNLIGFQAGKARAYLAENPSEYEDITTITDFTYDEYGGGFPLISATTQSITVQGDYSGNTQPFTCSVFTITGPSYTINLDFNYYSAPIIDTITYDADNDRSTFNFVPDLLQQYHSIITEYASIGTNNIIIGTSITLEDDRRDSINIGGIIFGTGSYYNNDNTINSFSGSANGRIGINVVNPTHTFEVSGSTSLTGSLVISEDGNTEFLFSSTELQIRDKTTNILGVVLNKDGTVWSFPNDNTGSLRMVNGDRFIKQFDQAGAKYTNVFFKLSESSNVNLYFPSSSGTLTTKVNGIGSDDGGNITLSTIPTASFVTGSIFSGSNSALSASYALTASYLLGGGGSGTTFSGGTNVDNRIVTATGTTPELNGEANLTFNGNTLSVTGNVTATSFTGSFSGSVFGYVPNSATSSFVTNSQTGSFVLNSQTSSFVLNSQTASFATTGSNTFIGNQTISGSLTVSGSSHTITGSLNVTNGITGSLQGTASWATNFVSASNYVLNSQTSSFVLNSQTASFATTGSNTFIGNQTITGSVLISGSSTVTGSFRIRDGQFSFSSPFNAIFIEPSTGNTIDITPADPSIVLTSTGFASVGINPNSGYYFTDSSNNQVSLFPSDQYNGHIVKLPSSGGYLAVSVNGQGTNTYGNITLTTIPTASFVTGSIFSGSNLALSASYALTASHLLGGGSGVTINNNTSSYLLTATGTTNTITGQSNLIFNGSTLIVTGSVIATSFTGSLQGTSSWATNALTASTVLGLGSYNVTQSFTNSNSWTFNHNLGNQFVIVQAYNNSNQQIIPENITLTNSNTATLTFPTTVSGYAIATIGGALALSTASIAQSVATLNQTVTVNGGLVFTPGTAPSFNGEIVRFGAGTLSTGQLYFLSSSGTWSLANANASGSSTGMLGLAVGSSPTTDGLLIRGFAVSSSYTYGTGSIVYMATGSGVMSATAPTSTNHIVRVLGYQTSLANTIYFDPDKTWVTLA